MERRLRAYTRRRLNGSNFFDNFLRNYSITTLLIIINVFVFVIVSSLLFFSGESLKEKIFSFIALQPNAFFSGIFWTLLTSMFMHGNFTHLLVNMVSLFFIGNFVEKLIGRKRFFWMYLLSGVFAGLVFVLLSYFLAITPFLERIFGSPEIFAVGASGAIFALAGLLAVLTPNLKVYVFFVLPMRMWIAIVFLLFVLWGISVSSGLPIGNTAHLGGLLCGVIYGVYLNKKYRKKTALIRQYFG